VIAGLELDHVFVSAPGKARDVGLLASHGLTQGGGRIHAGQGTANACFYFDNFYLELLWLHKEAEIRSAVVEPLALWERIRWQQTGACPFGVALRLRDGGSAWPPATWNYAAQFLPAGVSLPIVTPRGAAQEPLVFLSVGSPGPPSSYAVGTEVPLEHAGRRRKLRMVRLEVPSRVISEQVRAIEQSSLLSIQTGKEHHMRLEFENAGEELDFRPELPLSLVW
jgi:hypothetical protein